MVDLSTRVETTSYPTYLEAQVHELRLIGEYAPIYNRRSTRAHRLPWIRLTEEPLPRLSIVRSLPRTASGVGPFPTHRQAKLAMEALQWLGIRACRDQLPITVRPHQACILKDIGQCSAPCVNQVAADSYYSLVQMVEAAFTVNAQPAYAQLEHKMLGLAQAQKFEAAAKTRDQLHALVDGLNRFQRLQPWWSSSLSVGAQFNRAQQGWEIAVVKHGRLVASGISPRASNPLEVADHLIHTAAHVPPPTKYAEHATAEETLLIAKWMETPGTRLITHKGRPIATPLWGGRRYLGDFDRESSRKI